VDQHLVTDGGVVVGDDKFLWYSESLPDASGDYFGDVFYFNQEFGTKTNVPLTDPPNLYTFTLDRFNKRIFWIDEDGLVHRTSQKDVSDDVVIYSVPSPALFAKQIDYDKGRLVINDPVNNQVLILDDNGTVISSLDYGGGTSYIGFPQAFGIDTTNDLLIMGHNFGIGFGNNQVVKFTLSTMTEIARHPATDEPRRIALDRKNGWIFYGTDGGTTNSRIYKLDYAYTAETQAYTQPGEDQYAWDVDIEAQKLYVLEDASGNTGQIIRNDYDGSNYEVMTTDAIAAGTFAAFLEVNWPIDFADVEVIRPFGEGGVVCAGEATVSVIFGP
jgi:hypothetical protein